MQKVKLGQGSFGVVWRAVDRQTNKMVAVKQMDKERMLRKGMKHGDVEREISMMKACPHENITRLYNTYEDLHAIYLALEYCDGGDFGDKVKERGVSLTEEEANEWMRQVVSAVAALHSKCICHRDIKPDNFMISNDRLKLSDFGLALILPKGKLLTERCGTPAFMAPEQILLPKKSRGYGSSVDLWATGVLTYMVLTGGRHPFMSETGVLDEPRLVKGDFTIGSASSSSSLFSVFGGGGKDEARFSETARQFCRQLVNPSVSGRLTIEGALQHKWFGGPGATPRHPGRSQVPAAAAQQPSGGYPATSNGAQGSGGSSGLDWTGWAAAGRAMAAGPRALVDGLSEVKEAFSQPNPMARAYNGKKQPLSRSQQWLKSPGAWDDYQASEKSLLGMGFARADVSAAMERCSSVEEAALWLISKNGHVKMETGQATEKQGANRNASLRAEMLGMGFEDKLVSEALRRFSSKEAAVEWMIAQKENK